MKEIVIARFFIVVITLFFTHNAVSQSDSFVGLYQAEGDYVNIISDSTLEFKAAYGCCLLQSIKGFGNYKIVNNELYVRTIHFTTEAFLDEPMKEEKDKMVYFDLSGSSPQIIIGPYYSSKLERKREETKRRFRAYFTVWPWKWNKIWYHDQIPTTFKKV